MDSEFKNTKVARIYYRSIDQHGKVWCESSSKREVIQLSQYENVRYERLVVFEVTNGWEPWNGAD